MSSRRSLICGRCDLPFARIQNGVLVIDSPHRGAMHLNVITLEELRHMAEQSAEEEQQKTLRA
jgi:hypothetical protein